MTAAPIRVLLADDHPPVRVGVATILAAEPDIDVIGQAGDGPEAVALFRQLRPDVTILDLNMPGGGIDALAQIRGELPDARVLMLTMYAGDEDVFRSVEAGARGYLLKDASADELVAAVREVHAGGRHLGARAAERMAHRVPADPLTPRELDVLRLMARGCDNRAIAEALGIGVGTVKWHVATVLSKLDAPDRTNAVLLALRKGVIRLEP